MWPFQDQKSTCSGINSITSLSIIFPSLTSVVLELAKGKNAVELGSGDELIAALHALKAAALAGELNKQIEAASGALRAGFTK